jgi:uncharacterized sporulation protein YeaH/YhbH (DUF444 family)
MNIIDRRLNPKSKSLGNRQRFVRRAKADIREAVRDALKKRKVTEVEGSEKISCVNRNLRTAAMPEIAISSCPATRNTESET